MLLMSLQAEEKKHEESQAKKTDKPAEAAAQKPAAKEALVDESAVQQAFPDKDVYTKEEVSALKALIQKKTDRLEIDAEAEHKYLEELKVQVAEHLAKVEAARNEIASYMSKKDEKEEAKLKKLTKFYEAMEPEQAAKLFKEINDDLAMKMIERMNLQKAVGILSLMPTERAARLTANFSKLKLNAERKGSVKDGL